MTPALTRRPFLLLEPSEMNREQARRADYLRKLEGEQAGLSHLRKVKYAVWMIYRGWLARVRPDANKAARAEYQGWHVDEAYRHPCCIADDGRPRRFRTPSTVVNHMMTMKHQAYVTRAITIENQALNPDPEKAWPDFEKDVRTAYRFRRRWHKVYQTLAAIDGVKL